MRVPGDSRAKQWQVAGELFVKQLRSYYPQPLSLLIHWIHVPQSSSQITSPR